LGGGKSGGKERFHTEEGKLGAGSGSFFVRTEGADQGLIGQRISIKKDEIDQGKGGVSRE